MSNNSPSVNQLLRRYLSAEALLTAEALLYSLDPARGRMVVAELRDFQLGGHMC